MTAVRALRKIKMGKPQALAQLAARPELAGNISATARLWGVARATARAWLADAAAIAEPSPPPAPAMEAPPSPAEAFKAALCHLADLIETTTPEQILDTPDTIDLLGLHQHSDLV